MTWYFNLLNSDCTYWNPPHRQGYSGYYWDSPIILRCRWERHTELIIDETTGENIVVTGKVFLSARVRVGGFMVHGTGYLLPPCQEGGPVVANPEDCAVEVMRCDVIDGFPDVATNVPITMYRAFTR